MGQFELVNFGKIPKLLKTVFHIGYLDYPGGAAEIGKNPCYRDYQELRVLLSTSYN